MKHHSNWAGLLLAGLLGIPVAANAGVTVYSGKMDNSPVIIKMGGGLKLDQRFFYGDKGSESPTGNELGSYHSGGFLRDASLSVSGQLAEHWEFEFGLTFKPSSSKVEVEDAYVKYTGFQPFGKNFGIALGAQPPGWSLESTSSSKWLPFMERSMPTKAFGPSPGVGVRVTQYDNHYSFAWSLNQPIASSTTVYDSTSQTLQRSDRWATSARFTFAPIAEAGRVLQLGISGHLQDDNNAGIEFTTQPEMRARNLTTLLNTTNGTTRIASKRQSTVDIELTGQLGPWTAEAEYQLVHIKRGNTPAGVKQGEDLSFHGYHVQASYVLTGETRKRSPGKATFGQIIPNSKMGAWEVGARYSFINLNNEDVYGGAAHNTTFSVSWYANKNIRVIGEYVHSRQRRRPTTTELENKRRLGGLGLRLQAIF